MLLKEALEILKKNGAVVTEGRMTDHGYRWGGYMFNRGTKNTKWVQVLNLLYWSAARGLGGMKKNLIHELMGWSANPGNHSSMWTEMHQEGLIKYDKSNQTWKITPAGISLLDGLDLIISFNELKGMLPELKKLSSSNNTDEQNIDDIEKTEIDLDDDMYDDTPIVKQRDESFNAFAKRNGYKFIKE